MTNTFERLESQVRSYCRAFPTVFNRAVNAELFDESGRRYIDFLAGAGTLNYGHNNPQIKQSLLEYLRQDSIVHALDMYTVAKRSFLEALDSRVLQPQKLVYKVQFPGPTGTNAVEAAMKLARKVTGRHRIVAFTNGYHGMTAGSLSATGNEYHRQGSSGLLGGVSFMPFDGYFGPDVDTVEYLRKFIEDASSGLDKPAAIMLETVQGEGGVNVATAGWLMRVQQLCREHGILLIVDDIQAGCGRTGAFFSFSSSGVVPDIVTLSKSLSGYGLPMALVLIKPELDRWEPGEHNGTFRGHNLAFVTAQAAMDIYWRDNAFAAQVNTKAQRLRRKLLAIADAYGQAVIEVRGRGMFVGLAFEQEPELATAVSRRAFEKGLIVETCGSRDHVLKLLAPLTIEDHVLDEGLMLLEQAICDTLTQHKTRSYSTPEIYLSKETQ